MTVHCKACQHQWEIHVPLPISIPRFSTIVHGADAAGCPVCKAHGKGTLLVGPAVLHPAGVTISSRSSMAEPGE